jgi:hypothetical protein
MTPWSGVSAGLQVKGLDADDTDGKIAGTLTSAGAGHFGGLLSC